MMVQPPKPTVPEVAIDVVEGDRVALAGRRAFSVDRDIHLSMASLESYAFADYEPLVFDAMIVAASVEYADRILRRPSLGWARRFVLRVPVHDPARWNAAEVNDALTDALEFLTGDYWAFDFVQKTVPPPSITAGQLPLAPRTQAVIAFSNGMDSHAVAGIVRSEIGSQLVKVRLGTRTHRASRPNTKPPQFAGVPYKVRFSSIANKEATARHRGFKFAIIGGIAAYLAHAATVVIPESGQGAIGPALVTVAHAYPDYRNHPLFTVRMEQLLRALFGRSISFRFPRLWYTKGETLREYVDLPGSDDWASTRSCWQSNRWASVSGKLRQCGICAACLLRRMSVHSAGLSEAPETYIATDLSAETLDRAFDPAFRRTNSALREYAHAGVLHLDHLADMARDHHRAAVRNHAVLLASAFGASPDEIEAKPARCSRATGPNGPTT